MSILDAAAAALGLRKADAEPKECLIHRVPTIERRHGKDTERICSECTRLALAKRRGQGENMPQDDFQSLFNREVAQTKRLVALVAEQQQEQELERQIAAMQTEQIEAIKSGKHSDISIEYPIRGEELQRGPEPLIPSLDAEQARFCEERASPSCELCSGTGIIIGPPLSLDQQPPRIACVCTEALPAADQQASATEDEVRHARQAAADRMPDEELDAALGLIQSGQMSRDQFTPEQLVRLDVRKAEVESCKQTPQPSSPQSEQPSKPVSPRSSQTSAVATKTPAKLPRKLKASKRKGVSSKSR